MNFSAKTLLASVALLAALVAPAVTIKVDGVSPRSPWNGIVDIDYTLSYEPEEAELDAAIDRIEFFVTDNAADPAVTYRVIHIEQTLVPTSAGAHRITWLANGDGADFASGDVTVRAVIRRYKAQYLVIDVSAGANAETYSYETVVADDLTEFNADQYKGSKIALRLVPPGHYIAGSPDDEPGRQKPWQGTTYETQHPVTLSRPFYIGVFEVTQKQFDNVMGEAANGNRINDYSLGDFRPVDTHYYPMFGTMNWPVDRTAGANSFCGKINAKTGLTSLLPTEARWEYACRAGTTTPFYDKVKHNPNNWAGTYNSSAEAIARCSRTKEDGKGIPADITDDEERAKWKTHTTVGTYAPNDYGLYDMCGNLWELVLDRQYWNVEELGQRVDPVGCSPAQHGTGEHIIRGGAFESGASDVRSARRYFAYTYNTSVCSPSKCHGARIVVEYPGDDWSSACTEIASDSVTLPLDVSAIWTMVEKGAVAVSYSALGWDLADGESGAEVKLVLESADGTDSRTLTDGLLDRSVFSWTPSDMQRVNYTLTHRVFVAGEEDLARRLTATFDFTKYKGATATDREIRLALTAPSSNAFAYENDAAHPWQPADGTGDGLAASTEAASVFAVRVKGAGTLTFEELVPGGTFEIFVDGVSVGTQTAADWTAKALPLAVAGSHVITFSSTPGAGSAATVRALQWTDGDLFYGTERSEAFALDISTNGNVRLVKTREDVLPFTYSSTNFVGLSGTTAASIAQVTVVRITGEGSDYSNWTEVDGTQKTLVSQSGESTVSWRPKAGIWKAKFEIVTGTKVNQTETAYFDASEYGNGLIIFLR